MKVSLQDEGLMLEPWSVYYGSNNFNFM